MDNSAPARQGRRTFCTPYDFFLQPDSAGVWSTMSGEKKFFLNT